MFVVCLHKLYLFKAFWFPSTKFDMWGITMLLLFIHSCVPGSATPWMTACQASLSFSISWSLLKLMSFELVMTSNHLTRLCHPFLLLPSIFPSIRVFSNELALCIRWPKYWSFSFTISPTSEYSELISIRINWFDLLALQGTLKSLLQHHNSKASIPQPCAFFMVQLSHPYMTTGKTIALTIWTFVGKVMPLLFNTLSRFIIASLPRSKCLLISWLQSLSAVILEPKKIKSVTISIFSLFAMKWWDQMPWSLFFECWVLSQLFHSPLSMSGSHCYFLTCIQVSQKAGKVVWYSHLFNNFLVCCNSHSERLWCNQWSRSRCFFWNSLSFSMIQCMLAIWSVVPLPFLNLACTSGSSWFMYCSCTVQA